MSHELVSQVSSIAFSDAFSGITQKWDKRETLRLHCIQTEVQPSNDFNC
jgi:hypothetical protein